MRILCYGQTEGQRTDRQTELVTEEPPAIRADPITPSFHLSMKKIWDKTFSFCTFLFGKYSSKFKHNFLIKFSRYPYYRQTRWEVHPSDAPKCSGGTWGTGSPKKLAGSIRDRHRVPRIPGLASPPWRHPTSVIRKPWIFRPDQQILAPVQAGSQFRIKYQLLIVPDQKFVLFLAPVQFRFNSVWIFPYDWGRM